MPNLLIGRRILRLVRIHAALIEAYDCYCKYVTNRRWWVQPVNRSREKLGLFATSIRPLQFHSDEHFTQAMRMSVPQFELLLNLLRESLNRTSFRRPIAPEIRLSVTLLYLSQGASFQMLSLSFKLGLSTVRNIVYETCRSIWEVLHPVYLTLPNMTDWEHISEEFFSKTGMPNCLGAIDGKLINIVCPKLTGSLYYSYKKRFSIILLAACDADYTFTLVDVGAVGSQSDSGVFTRSVFGKKILENTLPVPADKTLPGTDTMFPHYFAADAAFPDAAFATKFDAAIPRK